MREVPQNLFSLQLFAELIANLLRLLLNLRFADSVASCQLCSQSAAINSKSVRNKIQNCWIRVVIPDECLPILYVCMCGRPVLGLGEFANIEHVIIAEIERAFDVALTVFCRHRCSKGTAVSWQKGKMERFTTTSLNHQITDIPVLWYYFIKR